jgi:pyruvate dehydrogenase E1 component beta subunit
MSSVTRKLSYALAINEAIRQSMETDDSVFLIGQGVKSPWYVGQTCVGLIEKFSERRVIDTPVSENAVTGAAVGAAISGMRPIVVHPRVDFMMYALDPIINEAANWHYMFGGNSKVPVVFWGIINRGGEQAAQHSQALQAMFAHIPGLKVVMPSNAYDAKGLLVAAIRDNNPVVFLDDRWLYGEQGDVPEELYEVPLGKAAVAREGRDCTIVSSSFLLKESLLAAQELKDSAGINVEVVDLRTIKPVDTETIKTSVAKTGRLLVGGWKSFGVSAEIAAWAAEECWSCLKGPVSRLALPDVPAPASVSLEAQYYIYKSHIVEKVRQLLGL